MSVLIHSTPVLTKLLCFSYIIYLFSSSTSNDIEVQAMT